MAGGGARRSDAELPRARRSAAGGELGIDAERRPFASVRLAASGLLSGDGGDALRALVQLHRRCAAGLHGPTDAAACRSVGVPPLFLRKVLETIKLSLDFTVHFKCQKARI